MLLALGPHLFDITHRAIVMGIVEQRAGGTPDSVLRDAQHLVDQGAHVLALGPTEPTAADDLDATDRLVAAVATLSGRFDQPLVVRTRHAAVARACFAAGAVAAHDDSGAGDPAYLAAVASAGATVVLGAGRSHDVARLLGDRARDAGAAGVDSRRIVLDAGVERSASPSDATELLRDHDRIAQVGWPVLLSAAGDQPSTITTFAAGVLRGARILRTRDVRAARRVAEVAARLLHAHDASEDLQEVR